jgi:hypothetical protein
MESRLIQKKCFCLSNNRNVMISKKFYIIFFVIVILFINKNSSAFFICQNFDNPSFPPAGWTLYTTNVYNWDWSIMCSGYGSGYGSLKANFCDADYGIAFDIISPNFNPASSGDSLIFDHAYTTSFAEQNDKLLILYSTNNGGSWTQLVLLNGGNTGQLTTAEYTGQPFVPTSAQWATKRYALPAGTNKLKFTAISSDGNNLYLDNIKIGSRYNTDAGAIGFKRYIKAIVPNSIDTPKVFVRNFGTTTKTIPVTLAIPGIGYTHTVTASNIGPGEAYLLTFPTWTANSTGNVTMKAYTTLTGDQDNLNDTIINNYIISDNGRNVLLEYCTGIWCSWCPCADYRALNLESLYPNTVILSYHGGSLSDPYSNFNGSDVLPLLNLTGYPLGIFDRQIDPWISGPSDFVERPFMKYLNSPVSPVKINFITKNYNPGTRILSITLNATALENLTGQYKISYVITEDNLVYEQFGNTWCLGGTNFIHKWVVRNMINNATGENLNTGGVWTNGQVFTKTFSTTLNQNWVENNCKLKVFVYLNNTPLNLAEIQQAVSTNLLSTGINEPGIVPIKFELSQNYPNPFNPNCNIKFSIPKNCYSSLKIYDITGRLVATYLDGFIYAGYYNAEIDGSKLSSGVYFYTLISEGFKDTKLMVLIK